MKITSRRLLALAVATVLAGCSSSATHSTAKAHVVHPSQYPSQYRPGPADDAATIASHIPGCTGAEAGDVGDGGPDLVSVATCTLTGHLMTVYTWSGPGMSMKTPALLAPKMTFVYGPEWTVTPPDNAPPAAQRELAARVAAAFGGVVHLA